MRKFLVLLCVILLLGAAVANAQEMIVSPGDPIVFGVSVGLSGEGIAPLGEDIKRGIEIAQSESPTLTIGDVEFTIELDVQDSQCNAEGGVAVATRFASDSSIAGVIGPMCSSACFPAAPIYDAAGYSSISPSCTNGDLSRSGFTSFNRTASSDYVQGANTAHYVLNVLGITRAATIHDGSPYAEGLVDVFSETFSEIGGEIVAADAVTVGDTSFQSLLSEIAEAEPELIYFSGFPAEAARLMQQRADVGLEETVFFGADGWKGTEVIELAAEAAEGTIATAPVPVSATEEQEAAYNAFLATYEEIYGETPLAPFHVNGYDAYYMLYAAVEAAGSIDDEGNLVIDRAALAEFLRSYGPVNGLTGTLECDGSGECIISPTGVFQVVDGVFEQIGIATGE
ncbi:MAG: branched-chain amino acid ABC transporter substrate-binding protein [Anaerolineaceae bacterium]|nr:branched-chain amino acid ABC transporter substrate-binding protein [Anaerolineaceae bacterium]